MSTYSLNSSSFVIIFPMKNLKEHMTKKWEVSIIELSRNGTVYYKVTRRLAEVSVAETKIFNSKEKAVEQFEKWLN